MARPKVIWVIKHNGVEHTFKTLKAAKEAPFRDPVLGALIIYRRVISKEFA